MWGQTTPEVEENWEAVGYLHDYDYEKYPEEHAQELGLGKQE